jgi:molybdopterin-dependent oxidoreductase alpha subunit
MPGIPSSREREGIVAGTLKRRVAPYAEIVRAAWENRDRAGYAWRILQDGVCDGCALGTSGMRDWTQDGVHLCWLRLSLLRLNTMPPLDPARLTDIAGLTGHSERDLRRLGRLPFPLLRRPGDRGFTRVSWDDAFELMTERLRAVDPGRAAFYVVSRGTVNETYYAAQKAARAIGTNHVDNSARVCHSPSTVALKETIGFGASTVSYRDLIGTDLVVFFGSNPANNQPVLMKYLHLARKAGTRIAIVNPLREPGMERYWVPSTLESALFGTRIADAFFPVRVGGDIAFLNGVLKRLIASGKVDRDFIAAHTAGWESVERSLAEVTFEELEAASGASRESMEQFAEWVAQARTAVFVWSMGITMHRDGVDNVKAIVNLCLARGFLGKAKSGLMAIRGHSGVQGGSEMGCAPNFFPGGMPVGPEGARGLASLWGFPVPDWRGHFMVDSIEAAARGELDVLYSVGSNLTSILPDRRAAVEALRRIPLRVHHDIVLNPSMLVDPGEVVLLLPATTRYEMPGGNTETSTERRVILNPEIPGPRVAEARDEWRVLMELAARVRPNIADRLQFDSTAAIRDEIARVIPQYDGIQRLGKKGDQFQWGGERLAEGGRFGTPDGRGRFTAVRPRPDAIPEGWFRLTTRRGKQFNSMVLGDRDALLDAERLAFLIAPEDMRGRGLRNDDPVRLQNPTGSLEGRVRSGPVHAGTVLVTWPEANCLIPRDDVDPVSGMPAYRGAAVELVPLGNGAGK